MSLCLLSLTPSGSTVPCAPAPPPSNPKAAAHPINDPLLDTAERRAFNYFWNEADPHTGLVKDRAGNFAPDHYTVSSVAATGFGLAALTVGCDRGWITRQQTYDRAETTLKFFQDHMPEEHGWFYHFVDPHTGARAWQSEVSSIDTAFLLAGALLVGQYFHGAEVDKRADAIYRRVDFNWMLTNAGARPQSKTLCHGWTPEKGFLPYRWDSYCEHMILYLLALGSPTHPIPASCWDAWERPVGEYAGYKTFTVGPLFTHQFSHAFVDFRGKQDRLGFDYWLSSVNAVWANRQFCIDHAAEYHTYGPEAWGLSACDGPDGYRAYSAPPGPARHDGTVAPLAAVASIVFTPDLSLSAMRHLYGTYGNKIWGRYGFSGAFNLDRNWFDQDVIGIDLGCALLMLENHRTGMIWKQFMQIHPVEQAMHQAGFVTHRASPAANASRSTRVSCTRPNWYGKVETSHTARTLRRTERRFCGSSTSAGRTHKRYKLACFQHNRGI